MDHFSSPRPASPPPASAPDTPTRVESATVLGILLIGAGACYQLYHQLIGVMLREIWQNLVGGA